MPRRMSPEREREYEELHAFIDWFATNIQDIEPADPVHPTIVGKRIAEEHGRSKALQGLKQAANDTVEQYVDAPPEIIEGLDHFLTEAGLVAFSEIRRRYGRSYQRILKRGAIKSETEFHLIAGILADVSLDSGSSERKTLERFVAEFQKSI